MYFDPSDRPQLKQRAKAAMRKVSPNIYLVSVVCLLLTTAPNFVINFPTVRLMFRADSLERAMEIYQNSNLSGGFALSLAVLAMNVFLTLVTCGWQLYTLRASRGEDPGSFDTLFACFRQFWRFLCVQILMDLFIFLWTMLFIIPGIIASLAYSQTIYIMLDHPDMPVLDAIRASKQLMKGHKWEYFVLGLSFIGWSILSSFTLGLLSIWLTPYQYVTFANYYNGLVNWTGVPEEAPAGQTSPDEWWKE